MDNSELSSHGGAARAVVLVCLINDPFDPPGARRIGGGHLVLRELGGYLVSQGFDVTHVTRLNDPAKPAFSELGPRARIHRLEVGPTRDVEPGQVGLWLDPLEAAFRTRLAPLLSAPETTLHSQYWIGGEICRRVNPGLRHVHHLLSLGRQKAREGEAVCASGDLRTTTEIAVFNAVDCIIAQCPSEAAELLTLYPEITHRRIAIVPHGVDPDVFTPA